MKILLAIIVILLSSIGGIFGLQMRRFCKTHTPEGILKCAKKLEIKMIIQIWLFVIVTVLSIALILITH